MLSSLFSIIPQPSGSNGDESFLAMNTPVQRMNSICSYMLTCVSFAFSVIAFTSFFHTRPPGPTSIQLHEVNFVRGHEDPYMPMLENIARFDFDLNVDLAPVFESWNTKQVVLLLTIAYDTPTHAHNSIVIWDRIVRRSANHRIILNGAKAKYNVVDVHNGLLGHAGVRVELHCNVIPWVGVLQTFVRVIKEGVRMPEGPPKQVYNYK